MVRRNFRLLEVLFRAKDRPRGPRVASPGETARVTRTLLPHDGREHFVVLLLDGQYRILAWHRVAIGGLHSVRVSPREVYAAALRMVGCKAVIVAHNHPSGIETPSRADLNLTRDIAKVGNLLEVPLVDHIIHADGCKRYVSLAARKVIK